MEASGVLVVDDDIWFLTAIKRGLGAKRRVFGARTLNDARAVYRSEELGVAIVDAHLGHESGLDLLYELREQAPRIRTALLTGLALETVLVDAAASGTRVIATKPVGPTELLREIETHSGRAPKVLQAIPASLTVSAFERGVPMAMVERDLIVAALKQTSGNRKAAALQLGISRTALYTKMKAMGLKD